MPQDQKQYWLVWLHHVLVFKINLGVSVGVILFELAAIAIWSYMDIPLVSANNSNTLYMLSTSAQSLAAIVGLVFAIFLVFSQISMEISHSMLTEMLEDKPSFRFLIMYLVLFIFTIGLTLWLLADPNHQTLVQLSLTLTALCLCLLLPFIYFMKQRLCPRWWMKKWADNVISNSSSYAYDDNWWGLIFPNESERIPKDLQRLQVIAERAAASHNTENFEFAIKTLVEIISETETKSDLTWLSNYIVERISEFGHTHNADALVTRTVVENLLYAAFYNAINSDRLLLEFSYYFTRALEEKASDSLLVFYVEQLSAALGWQLDCSTRPEIPRRRESLLSVPDSVKLLETWAIKAAIQKYPGAPRHVVRCFLKWGLLKSDITFDASVSSVLGRLTVEVANIDSQLASYALAALWHLGADNLNLLDNNRPNSLNVFVDELSKVKASVDNNLFLSGIEQARIGTDFPSDSWHWYNRTQMLNKLIPQVNKQSSS